MGPQVPIEIIEAARTGRAPDVERLLALVWTDAYRLSKAIVANRQCAEDVAQEACVIMFRHVRSLRNAEAFRTWFYRIVVREALKQKAQLHASPEILPDPGYCEDPSPSLDLWRALSTLTDKHRTAIVLHYFEGLPTREIGEVLHIPDATVRFRLMAARRKLKPLLKDIAPTTASKGEGLYAL